MIKLKNRKEKEMSLSLFGTTNAINIRSQLSMITLVHKAQF